MNILVSLRPTWLIQKAFFGLGFITPLHNSGAFLFACVAQPLTSVHAFQKCCVALYPEIAKIREESPVYALSHSVNFHPPNIVLFYWDASPVCKQLQYTAPSKPTPPHPPKQSAIFLDEFSRLPSIIHSNYDRLIITGDFKLHFDNPADAKSNGFQKCCMLYGFNACRMGLLHTVYGCNALHLICGFHDGNGFRDRPIMASIRSFSLIFPFKFQINHYKCTQQTFFLALCWGCDDTQSRDVCSLPDKYLWPQCPGEPSSALTVA